VAGEIVMPRLSDSMEEGTILTWLVAEGDEIEPGRPLAEIETDKATVVYEADAAGVIQTLTVSTGASVPVGAPIAVISDVVDGLGGQSQAVTNAAGSPEALVSAAVATAARPRRPAASPLARRVAAELGVDLAGLTGSGPYGRVIRADVDHAAGTRDGDRMQPVASEGSAAAPATTTAPATTAAPAKGRSERQQLTRLQQTVARRMSESRATVPDIELRVEVDMGAAVTLHERLREIADPCPTVNDLVIKAAALALRAFARVNSAYRDAAIETFSRVNVGIAVATEDGLVVPTIFDADLKSLGDIGRTTRTLAQRAREGSITPAELSGGTFTVSNLGMYGIDSFSAVINPPQAAILAVGAIKRRPVVDRDSGDVLARPTMILTLACDHRILYGVDGARFVGRVRELLERPHSLLL
jgi:pyruvate dehydrogenase E2 component (dihydrolipoyllysine-residue acetyltransferase)